MGVINALSVMHREAVEQVRAGEHSAFLVGFLTTSTMLELAGLVNADLRLDDYAQAAAETITQYAPIDRVRVRLLPHDFASTSASVGFHTEPTPDEQLAHTARAEADGVGVVELAAADVAEPLAATGFLTIAAKHIVAGLGQILESERRRRRAAVSDALALVAALNEQWGQNEFDALASSLSSLPGVHACRLSMGATRLAGVLTAAAGQLGQPDEHVVERSFTIDEQVQADVRMVYRIEPASEQLAVLDEVLSTLAASLSRIEQNVRLTSEAETDQLTGVANRRRVGKSLAAARAMSDRRAEPFAVLLFDLDHFKSINDRLGHPVGDAVLMRFAVLLQSNTRPFDTVARWGGEEFMLLCPDCGVAGAVAISERVLEACPTFLGDVLPPGVIQTTSVGIAVYPERGHTPETVIHAADEALYRAKREGRNRWSVAGMPSKV